MPLRTPELQGARRAHPSTARTGPRPEDGGHGPASGQAQRKGKAPEAPWRPPSTTAVVAGGARARGGAGGARIP